MQQPGNEDHHPMPSVPELDTAGQFIVWAMRQHALSGSSQDAALIEGFLLAFGLAHIECALANFETLTRSISAYAFRPFDLRPFADRRLSADEAMLVRLFSLNRAGRTVGSHTEARTFVKSEGWLFIVASLSELSRLFAASALMTSDIRRPIAATHPESLTRH